jgi:ketosteroid isomerase-like protein
VKAALAVLLLGISMPVVASPAADATAIRAARMRYNAAVLGRDVTALRTMFVDDYTGIAGSDGTVIKGSAAMIGYFANAFRNPAFITFVRTPQAIEIADDGGRAMERGHWLGRSVSEGGEKRLTGEYLAVWVPVGQGWQLRSESFVTLGHGEGPP